MSRFRRSASRSRYSSYSGFAPYVPAAERRKQAANAARLAAKGGAVYSPVTIEGGAIARTFWGKAWCKHIESFSDYANRLPRGRTYVRNGSVIDLQIARGQITARIMGSELYEGTFTVTPLAASRWAALKAECSGKIDSLVGLLQGRLSDAVMKIITDRDRGLFPSPSEIKPACSCPDYASLCKHLAAVLYGVGARLDTQPELLFVLRGVDHLELIGAAADPTALSAAGDVGGGLDATSLSDVFGIEIDDGAIAPNAAASVLPGAAAVSAPPADAVPRRKSGRGKLAKPAVTKSKTQPKTAAKKKSVRGRIKQA